MIRAAWLLIGAAVLTSASGSQDIYVNAQVPWHSVVLDAQGKLLAWYQPARNLGYDQVIRLGWDFIEHKVPTDTRHGTGLKIYLINSVYDAKTLQGTYWQHNPAMVFASFVDSLVGWYPYSGDEQAVQAVREMLDHQLAHGTTPADWEWAQVPFATSCDDQVDYGHCVQDMPHEFYGGIETDKVGELGTGYALFYELTGDRKYLDAAVRCAQALARHVRVGDAEHTPWPFRVDAHTGVTLALEEYGGDVAGSLRLFEELIKLNAGDLGAWRKARQTALAWLLEYPLNAQSPAWNKWSGYFEDIPRHTDDVNQLLPMITAYYILARENPAEVDPQWMGHVGRLLDWVRIKLGADRSSARRPSTSRRLRMPVSGAARAPDRVITRHAGRRSTRCFSRRPATDRRARMRSGHSTMERISPAPMDASPAAASTTTILTGSATAMRTTCGIFSGPWVRSPSLHRLAPTICCVRAPSCKRFITLNDT